MYLKELQTEKVECDQNTADDTDGSDELCQRIDGFNVYVHGLVSFSQGGNHASAIFFVNTPFDVNTKSLLFRNWMPDIPSLSAASSLLLHGPRRFSAS